MKTEISVPEHFKSDPNSPFHEGEQVIQASVGQRENMERFGAQVIRNYFPDQHRQFYSQLPFLFVGHVDADGWPWASVMFNPPGFISSPNEKELNIKGSILNADPLREAFTKENLNSQTFGFLGIELSTKRRNRFSAKVESSDEGEVRLSAVQTFGNCPQYIQSRDYQWRSVSRPQKDHSIRYFDDKVRALIEDGDTFFVSSAYAGSQRDSFVSKGADISHRGGRPGFVKVNDDRTLLIPDYAGNNHFNTLGNLIKNPKAGLLFIDFESGAVVMLTGKTKIFWDHEDLEYFEGAERLWQFELERGVIIENAIPFTWTDPEYSINSVLTGTWHETAKNKVLAEKQDHWHTYVVDRVVKESSVIKSFYLRAKDDQLGKTRFQAGQFISVSVPKQNNSIHSRDEKHIRTYTVSSAPSDPVLRISVKHEEERNAASHYLHTQIEAGDEIEIKLPQGDFYLDVNGTKPIILLAGGIGITPMLSMVRESLLQAVRKRNFRSIYVFSSARNTEERGFHKELTKLAEQSGGLTRYVSILSQEDEHSSQGDHEQEIGRINRELVECYVELNEGESFADFEVYVCGPNGFMQSMYDMMLELGTDDEFIFAESFGPASLERQPIESHLPDTAEQAIVRFESTGAELNWQQSDGTLLEFAEAHGLQPEFSCRSGVCGSCKYKVKSGKVAKLRSSSVPLEEDEVLLCNSAPAKNGQIPLLVIDA